MVLKHYFDIGVAVGAAEGLVVPVLRDADRMSFAEIEKQIRTFAKKAKDGTLTLADLQGRHVHDHQRRRLRLAPEHADPQPAAGRHPRSAQDPGPADRRQRPGRRPADDVRRPDLRPPHRRWCAKP